ncbi:MAG TPA: hypothetical protein DCR44_05465 [Acholeplasmatales bacterium]|nr:hypothetical protein [Acholeplasmatales bacterium]
MNAGFLKRAVSSLIDLIIAFAVVALVFVAVGRTLLQNQVEHFDVINTAYDELRAARDADMAAIYTDYEAAIELAGNDEDLKTQAQTDYVVAQAIIESQHAADIAPYDTALTGYYMTCIYFFSVGFLIIMGIYTLATGSKTLGRRLMQIKLTGPVNLLSIFFHDVVIKYFFLVIVFSVSPYAGLALIVLSFVIDFILINFTKRKAALRDILLKMEVVKTGYGY